MTRLAFVALFAVAVWGAPTARASTRTVASAGPDAGPALLCRGAIAAAEAATGIPDAFLSAIGRVESGRSVSRTGVVAPWPWTVNAAGQGHFYNTRDDAVAAVRQFQSAGIQSVDVGCLQVNLMYHKGAFASLEQAFEPAANAAYAARLLLALHTQTGSWPRAAAAYHSQTPAIGQAYQEKVLAAWAVPDRRLPYRAADATAAGDAPAEVVHPHVPEATRGAIGGAALPGASHFQRSFNTAKLPAGTGRALWAYRAMPVRLALRVPN
jgi:hypothetical protein